MAPTATRPKQANGNGKVLPVADTLATTPPTDTAEVLNTVKTITPPTGQSELDNAMTPKQSTTAMSTTRGNEEEPGKASEKQATTKGGGQATSTKDRAASSATSTKDSATSTKDSKKAADSNG